MRDILLDYFLVCVRVLPSIGSEENIMTDSFSNREILRRLGPGGRGLPVELWPNRDELAYELQKYIHAIGPTPKRCLETLVDLGLSDPEIARYFKIPKDVVTDLRCVWNIEGST